MEAANATSVLWMKRAALFKGHSMQCPRNLGRAILICFLASPPAFAVGLQETRSIGRTVRSLDADWRFHKGDTDGAQEATFDDSGWQGVDVPHDWSIEGPFDQK